MLEIEATDYKIQLLYVWSGCLLMRFCFVHLIQGGLYAPDSVEKSSELFDFGNETVTCFLDHTIVFKIANGPYYSVAFIRLNNHRI